MIEGHIFSHPQDAVGARVGIADLGFIARAPAMPDCVDHPPASPCELGCLAGRLDHGIPVLLRHGHQGSLLRVLPDVLFGPDSKVSGDASATLRGNDYNIVHGADSFATTPRTPFE